MTTYRIYYAEREIGDRSAPSRLSPMQKLYQPGDYIQGTEWEEEVEAESYPEALDAFFRNHVKDHGDLMWLDGDGRGRPVEGLDLDPDAAYIWREGEKLMEYQGIDEATPGMVSCPLCGGHGEVDQELADEYLAEFGEDEDEAG